MRSPRRTARCATGCRGAGRRSTTASCARAAGRPERRALRDREGRAARRGARRADRPRRAAARRSSSTRSAGGACSAPARPAARGAALPRARGPSRRARRRDELHVWVERALVRRGYGWRVPRRARSASASAPTTRASTSRSRRSRSPSAARRAAGALPGQLVPAPRCARPPTTAFFAGDSAGHCFPLSGEGIRTAFYFGIAAGREIRAVLAGEATRDAGAGRLRRRSAPRTRRRSRGAALQRLIPRCRRAC